MTSLARAWTLGAVAVLLATQVATAPVLSIGVGQPSGSVVELQVGGREGVPTDASAAVLNVTVDAPQGDGFATVWPCGEQRPLASNLNYHVGQTIANLVIARLGTGGKVCIFVQTGTHVIADVSGYFPAGSDYVPIINPVRLLDTRDGTGGVAGAVPSESVVELQVGGREGVPTDALAAVLNVTVDAPQGDGFATVWPCGERRPPTSNLNFQTGRTIANLVVSRLGTGGKVCIFVQTGTHVIADVSGYFPAGSDYVPIINPVRLLDTRDGTGGVAGAVPSESVVELQVGGREGVPTDALAAVLNVTVDAPQGDGFATVWPCGERRPPTSNLNFQTGRTIANLVVSRLGTGGKVCIFVQTGTHVIADVSGYFPAGSDYVAITNPARVIDILSILCPAIGCGPLYAFVELHVGGRQGVPTDASAAVLNVTVDHPQGDGFATVWPCGEQRPLASNLNYHVGQTIANLVIARLGTGGKVCIFVDPAIGARVIADVSGYFPAGSDYVPIINPVRLLDTRDGTGT